MEEKRKKFEEEERSLRENPKGIKEMIEDCKKDPNYEFYLAECRKLRYDPTI